MKTKNMTTLHLKKSADRSPLRLGFFLMALVLACFALLPSVQASPDPAPPPVSNTRDGQGSLAAITTGLNNSAFGTNALNKLTIGSNNAAQGNSAQFSLIDGINNTALGVLALRLNAHGDANTAVGRDALYSNIDSSENTAVGWRALYSNTNSPNTAVGSHALFSNTTGDSNNAVGFQALYKNAGGVWNNAVGYQALFNNVAGSYNTAIGDSAGWSVTGSGNVCIGEGVFGVAGENDTTRIRNVYSSVASTRAVYVNSDNKIGTILSTRRVKDDIKPMDKTSEAVLALKPVIFRYKKEIEPNGAIMFGLIAEEVEKVAPDLVTRDAKGEVETVRYEAVNAMLLNEFLKGRNGGCRCPPQGAGFKDPKGE
jgi:trimeric autotransporter adhesin